MNFATPEILIASIGAPEVLIALLVIALLFGGAKLPKLARSLGSAKGEFEKGIRDGETLASEPKTDEIATAEAPKDATTES